MAAPTAPILGFNAKAYYNTGSYGVPTWTAITNIGDVTMTDEASEASIAIRSMGGFEISVAGLRKVSWEFSMVYDPADTVQSALYTAYAARTPKEFAFLDQASGTAGSSGLRATCMIAKMPRQEKLSEALMYEVKIVPTYAANAPSVLTTA